ncbi:ATP-binding protein [Streptomyces sp. NPDC059578]|uniref:ATP-binding protein n=1 Tax=unclassified Streptomyces TaxID=2593676 RepID=UPI00364F09CC
MGAGAMAGRARVRRLKRRFSRTDGLRAVPESRRAVRELLGHWGRPGQAETAELLTSELVTNALVHTDRAAVLRVAAGPRRLRVEVRDFVRYRPRPRGPVPHEATGGRGLMLVESLSDRWGVRGLGIGKTVWFELETGHP